MKRAVITGASSGLGRVLAIELGRVGYEQALVARNQKGLRETLNAMPAEAKTRTKIVVADLSQREEVSQLISRCISEFGDNRQIDLLVNNAGFGTTGKIEDIPLRDYERSWQVNFLAPVSLIQQVLPRMKAEGRGMIVNVSSGVARRALPFVAPYSSTKAALNSFTESLIVELQATSIKVLLFSPGPMFSGFHDAVVHHGNTRLASPSFDGKPPTEIGNRLFDAIQKQCHGRMVVGFRATLAHHLNYWSPSLTDRLVGRLYKIDEVAETKRMARR